MRWKQDFCWNVFLATLHKYVGKLHLIQPGGDALVEGVGETISPFIKSPWLLFSFVVHLLRVKETRL